MPLPHFLVLLLVVISAAAATIATLHALDLSMGLAGLVAVALGLAVRAIAWR